MKKIAVITLLLLTSTSVMAHGWQGGYGGYRGGYGHYENHYNGGWGGFIGPALIGGVIGYELSQPRTVYQQPQVIYQQAPIVVQQQPQIVTPQQPLYRKESIYDQSCGCYKEVFVQVQ